MHPCARVIVVMTAERRMLCHSNASGSTPTILGLLLPFYLDGHDGGVTRVT